jgi:hypothetical protein
MIVKFTKPRKGISVYDKCIGIAYYYDNPRFIPIYRVIDKHLFMLSVIEYGLVFEEIKY